MTAAVAAGLAAALPLAGSAYAQSVLINDDFEVNYDGWAEKGGFTKLSAQSSAAYNSSRGMKVTGRTAASDGAFSEKGFYLDGGETYAYSVFVKHDGKSPETFNLTLRWLFPDGKTYGSAVIAATDVKPGQWAELSAKYAAPKTTVNLTLSITTNSTVDFFFDKFTVTGNAVLKKSAKAAAADGLKDIYAGTFRYFGTCLPANGVNNSTNTAIILREFNSVTPENELKPDATIQQNGLTNTNVSVSLSRAASILNFCVQNNISLRGHTLVWHSQTPEWFFKENGNDVTVAVMDQRMKSYIKNMFAAIKDQYPTLDLYAYDVVNEAVRDDGSPRQAGNGGDNSMWVKIYGNNSFIRKAFTAAREFAPPNCKLYYNDFNEYTGKRDTIINTILKPLFNDGLLNGMGMQSHLDVRKGNDAYPSVNQYGTAVARYSTVGCEIQITELDATVDNNNGNPNLVAQAVYYRDIMKAILDNGAGVVNGITVWGTMDNMSWRSDRTPLLFNSSGNKKPAYDSLAAVKPPKPIEPDTSGYFFHHTFEGGTVEGWKGRGAATVANSNAAKANGSRSLYTSGRTENWNGAAFDLSAKEFVPGASYSFSVMAMYSEGNATDTFQLSMQYDSSDGVTKYKQVAVAEVKKGEWVQLSNTEFPIPTGAIGLQLYVEMKSASTNFYIDDAMGGIAGAAINPDGTPGEPVEPPEPPLSVLNGKNAVCGHTPLVTVRGRTLNVNSSVDSKVSIRLVNMMGKTVANFNAAGNAKLSLKQIPAGAYIVEARRNNNDGYRMTSAVILR